MLYVSLNAAITRNDARDIVVNQIVGNEIENVNIYQEVEVYSDNSYELNPYKSLSVPYSNCWIFFIDDNPLANWEHECRYVFVNIENGIYNIVNEKVPLLDYETILEEVSINVVIEINNYQYENPEPLETREPDPHKYAILLSGETNVRHWNDMSAMYCALKEVYGYTDENMIVLSHSGEQNSYHNVSLDLDQDGTDDIQGACTYQNVEDAFQWMANELDSDDMLFVYVNDHGGTHNYIDDSYICLYQWAPLEDEEFATMVAPINCSEIIHVMEQCYAGGFQGELEGDHVTFHAATDGAHSSYGGTGVAAGFDEFVYYWTTATRGYHPLSNQQPWFTGHPLGEHELLAYDFNPDEIIHGGNGDGFIQMQEAFEYADYMDLYSPYGQCQSSIEFPQEYNNIGFQEDLLSLNGLCGYVENTQTITGNFMINPSLTIETGVSLTLSEDSDIYCLGELSLENNVNIIFGNNSIVKIDESATLDIGYNVSFTGYNIGDCGTLVNNSSGQTNYDETHFEYCNLISSNGSIVMIDSDFLGCYLSSENGALNISDSEFNDDTWSYHSYGILSNNDDEFYLDNVTVENYYQGIRLNYPACFKINNSISQNNHSHNFFVVNSRGINNEIYNSQFTGSSVGHGLNIYGSSLTATSCYIANNGTGILLMNRSNVTVRKDPNSNPWYLDSVILDNSWAEVTFYDDCRLHLADNRNKIIDNSYTPGTSDEFLINCPNLMTERDFSYNYWGYTDMYNNAILPPDNRFNPEGAYNLSPVYDPGVPREDEKTDDQIMYETAVTEAENGNTILAAIMLKDLIAQFPDSDYKRSSASYLLSIQEEDFQTLKAYFNGEPNLHSNDLIELYTAYLQTYCDIQSENYQEAIDWFESIITNPPSLVDSVYAVIDLGDLYLQMGGNGRGAVGRYPELIPQSKVELEETREDLFALLSEEYHFENEPEEEPSNNSLPACVTLNGNYPNPFNPETTISFSIPDDSKIELSVFNIKGQKVKSLVKDSFESGTHSVIWNGKDDNNKSVSSGIYFYKLNVNGTSKQIRKCILMK